jgi:DNA mismatch repair ATPase MutS
MNNPTFEGEFMEIAKGLPDLERIVSRIHAKNCKVKDFLKVLKVMISMVMFCFSPLTIFDSLLGC